VNLLLPENPEGKNIAGKLSKVPSTTWTQLFP
jgi:hypothetical protein